MSPEVPTCTFLIRTGDEEKCLSSCLLQINPSPGIFLNLPLVQVVNLLRQQGKVFPAPITLRALTDQFTIPDHSMTGSISCH